MRGFTLGQTNLKKNNGIFYTAPELARFVANLAISSADSTVLDPCCGKGALLLAARERLLGLECTAPDKHLFGYDLISLKRVVRMKHLHGLLDEKNVIKRDFFSALSQELDRRFDVILMNPPFVRHHLIPKNKQRRIRSVVGDDAKLPLTSDLWAYFIVHSLKFIKQNGTLVAILPWSFLQANFARKVRELLLEKFRRLRVVVIGQRMFEEVQERILVLIANGFGFSSTKIGIYYSFVIPKRQLSWVNLERDTWRESPWTCLVDSDVHKVLSDVQKNMGFEPLGHFAKVRIGTVTGANDFFILEQEVAKSMKLPRGILRPIIRHSGNLNRLSISSSDGIKDVILLIPEDMKLSVALREYIKRGVRSGVNARYHTRNRVKWYSIPEQKLPDAFLHYMTKEVPFLVLNPDGLLSTNTVHQVDFMDGVDQKIQKWIQFSMLTSISQLSAELLGRTYGGGILKIEPTAASEIIVYPGNGHSFPKSLENQLNTLLHKGKRREAINVADKWMIANLGISRKAINSIIKCYRNVRDLRSGEYFA